jgi:hypothetical protein
MTPHTRTTVRSQESGDAANEKGGVLILLELTEQQRKLLD